VKEILSGNEAIARGAYEAGVRIALGYPGTPSSEIIETIVRKYGKDVYAEWSVNEKVAMDAAAGAAYSGRRCLVTTKQVGMNVLSDSLLYTVYTGAEAGIVVVTSDDPGLFSSQNEQDNRWYSRLAKIPTLEPADSQEAKDFIVLGMEISEKFDIPVLFRTVMRVSHSKSVVELGDRQPTPDAVGPFPRNPEKYNCTASHAKNMHMKLEDKLAKIAAFADTLPANRIEWGDRKLGIVTSGVVYTYVREVFPEASILKLGMSFPLPEKLIREFAEGVETLLVIEELDPVIEEQIKAMGIPVRGKDVFPRCFELLPDDIVRHCAEAGLITASAAPALAAGKSASIPRRSPVFCPGCPHRSTFYLLNKMKLAVAGDIGCYNLGTLPPFRAQHTMGSMGASIGVLHGMALAGIPEARVCTIGDSTFFHAGIPPLINMVHTGTVGTVILMDNSVTAMTGHQDHPGVDWSVVPERKARAVDMEGLVKAIGVKFDKTVDAFSIKDVEAGLKECLAYTEGPSVLITKGPCIFVNREAKPAYHVDTETCIACGTCFKVGCPANVLSDVKHPKTGKFKAAIDPTLCNGCGVCAQVCPVGAIRR
jgi:indolepyruvate ferredoxin oxidoreductase alpha subunit